MDKKTFRYILALVACSILIIYGVWNNQLIFNFFSKALLIIRPVIIGFAIAFILNSPYMSLRKLYIKFFKKRKTDKLPKFLAILSVYLLLFLIIAALSLVVIPEIWRSINKLTENIGGYIVNLKDVTTDFLNKYSQFIPADLNIMDKVLSLFENIPDLVKTIFVGAFGFTSGFISTLFDIIIGLMISLYFMIGKEKFLIQSKKVLFAVIKKERAEKTISLLTFISNSFQKYIAGQLLEACIMGVMCFVGMSIFGFHNYTFLISVLIGATNVIPIVGPFIGTIPSVFILLLVDPVQAILFVVFEVALQNFEANIVFPRVVGTQVGLPSFWVLISVLIGGGLFGLIGMVLAVPTMSIIYELTKRKVNERLLNKEISIQ